MNSSRIERTVEFLFRELNRQGVRYAVLRNHAALPSLRHFDGSGDITDIDLVVHSDDLSAWQIIARQAAQAFDWDVLTQCDHWKQSASPCHWIEVFRFYRFSELEFIQVDIFHSHIVWGLPVLSERDLLQDRYVNENAIVCAGPPVEAAQLLFKVRWSAESSKKTKVVRYREQALKLWFGNAEARTFMRRVFSSAGVSAFEALARGDLDSCFRSIGRARAFAFTRYVARHPFAAARHILARRFENRKRFVTNPCGRVANVYTKDKATREVVRLALNRLRDRTIVESWKELAGAREISSKHRRVMEQGGLIINWTDDACADLQFYAHSDIVSAGVAFLALLLRRHEIVYRSTRVDLGADPQMIAAAAI